jgi:hypothetical protein
VTNERLGDLFFRDAAEAGHATAWVAHAAGRLGVGWAVVEELVAEFVPADRAAADALGARYGVDGRLLWSLVVDWARREDLRP